MPNSHRRALTSVASMTLGLLSPLAGVHAQCTPAWSDSFASRGIPQGSGAAAATWNDGLSTNVYVGGEFTRIGNIPYSGPGTGAGCIARWDGSMWHALDRGVGPSSPGEPGGKRVNAIAPFTAGPGDTLQTGLYVGGLFQVASGQTVNNIARWDGSSWNPLGGGLAATSGTLIGPQVATVRKVLVHQIDAAGATHPTLWVLGSINFANWNQGNVPVNGLATWDGNAWSNPVTITNLNLSPTLTTLNSVDEDGPGPALPVLYVGGAFDRVNGQTIRGLVRFDGVSWTAIPGFSGVVNGFASVYDAGQLTIYVSGEFNINGSTETSTFARLRNGVWETFPFYAGIAGASGPYVYLVPNGDPSSNLVRLSPTGTVVEPIAPAAPGSPLFSGATLSITPVDFDLGGPDGVKLLCAGTFTGIGSTLSNGLALVNGTTAEAVTMGTGPGGLDSWGVSGAALLDVDGPGPLHKSLLLGGVKSAGALSTAGAVRFDGAAYTNMPTATINDPDLGTVHPSPVGFAAGTLAAQHQLFAAMGNNGVYRWDGSQFAPFAATDGSVDRVHMFTDAGGPALFVFGHFTQIAGQSITGIARFDGVTWTGATAGLPGVPADINTVHDVQTLTFGSATSMYFTYAVSWPSTPRSYLVRWNGSSWTQIDTSAFTYSDFAISDMRVFGGQLYAAGAIYYTPGSTSPALARFDGVSWQPVGVVGGSSHTTSSLCVHNDGTGDALYVGGRFTSFDGAQAFSLVKFNGTTFTAVPGVSQVLDPQHLISFDEGTGPALYVIGGFVDYVDGKSSFGLARLKTPCPSCRADFNHVNGLEVQDIFDFLNAWFAGTPESDFNGVNGLEIQDIFDFLNAWFAGCP